METARYLMACIENLPATTQKYLEELLFELKKYFSLYQVHRITQPNGKITYRFKISDAESGEISKTETSDTLEEVIHKFEKESKQKYDPQAVEVLAESSAPKSQIFNQITKVTHLVNGSVEYRFVRKQGMDGWEQIIESGPNLSWIVNRFEKETKTKVSIPELEQDSEEELPEVSKEVIKQLETFAKGGGKTSEPDIATLTEALKLCGWSVNTSIWKNPLEKGKFSMSSLASYSTALTELWQKSDKKVKTKLELVSFWNRTDDSGILHDEEIALIGTGDIEGLLKTGLITLGSESSKIGTIQAKSLTVTPYQRYHEPPQQVFKFINAYVVLPLLTITAPNGKTIEVKCSSDTSVKTSTIWKFFYENGLQEKAQSVIVKGFAKTLTDEEIILRSRSGLCPVCMRYIERRDDGRIMRHGWRRFQYLTAPPCFGWTKEPWEKSPNGAIEYLDYIQNNYLPSLRADLKKILTNPPAAYYNLKAMGTNEEYRKKRNMKEYFVRGQDKEWEWSYQGQIAEIKNEITHTESFIPKLQKRIQEWKPQPFWFEVHAEQIREARTRKK